MFADRLWHAKRRDGWGCARSVAVALAPACGGYDRRSGRLPLACLFPRGDEPAGSSPHNSLEACPYGNP
jgi:hypothetical protein